MKHLFACLLILLLSACDAPLTFLAGESEVSGLRTVSWSGDAATAASAGFKTARTQADWEALWQQTGQAYSDTVPGPLPSGKMAVGVFLGQRFERDLRVEITRATVERQRIGQPPLSVVVWREVKPERMQAAGEATSQAAGEAAPAVAATASNFVNSPWTIRLVDASVLPPEFRQER